MQCDSVTAERVATDEFRGLGGSPAGLAGEPALGHCSVGWDQTEADEFDDFAGAKRRLRAKILGDRLTK